MQEVLDFQDADTIQLEPETAYQTERGKPMPSKNHAKIAGRITTQLGHAYEDKFEIHIELSLNLSTGKAMPDICLLPAGPSEWFQDELAVTEPPLMVLEILSPTQGTLDLTEKMNLYFGAGVKTYWVVIPPFRTIHVITPDRNFKTFTEGVAKDPVLGIEVDMAKVFR